MLQAIRDQAMGVLGWIIIGLIIITFALFGLGSYLQNESRVYAAKVNDVEISPRELQEAYQNQRLRMEQMLGDAFNPALIDNDRLKERALDMLIQRELILQAAEGEGMAVSDQFLAAQIQSVPAFQAEGKFDESLYTQLLAQQGRSPSGFEYETRRMLTAEQLVNGLSDTAFVTGPEVARAYRLQDQKRSFAVITVAASPFEATIEPDDAAIEAHYKEHSEQYMTPERVKVSYVRLDSAVLGESIEIADDAVDALYEQKKTTLKTQEQRQASHILFQLAADADEQTIEQARADAEKVLAEIRAGGDFAALAREHSDDPGSAANGGDLGYFATGAMVPEFDEAVFSMKVDEVSDLVRTQFGFHIITLKAIKGSEIPTLEEVRADLVDELKQREMADLYYELLERLTDVSYENPDNLEAAADELQLTIQTSDWMSASGQEGIAQYPQVRTAAFSEDVLEAGNNSEPLEVGPNDAIVLRVAEREAAHPTPLDEVKAQIVTAIRKERATQAAQETAEQLIPKMDGEDVDLEALAAEHSAAFQQVDDAGRSQPGYSPELMRAIFKLQRPEGNGVVIERIGLSNGDHAVVLLGKVTDADDEAMTDAQRTQLKRGFENMRRSQAMSVLVEDLRTRANVEIPDEAE